MGQIKFMTSLLMIGIFSVAIISFMVGFATDNSSVVSLADDPDFVGFSSTANTELGDDLYEKTNIASGQYQNSSIDLGSETTRTGQVFKDGGFQETYSTFKGMIDVVNKKVFGGKGSPFGFVLTAFVGFLAIIFVMLSWKTWKGGNPE